MENRHDTNSEEPATRLDPARRVYCDKCPRCTAYRCDGSTARHHNIHIYSEPPDTSGLDNDFANWLLQHTGFSKYPDRDSGV